MKSHNRHLVDLVVRTRALPLAADSHRLIGSLVLCPPDGAELFVQWPEGQPLSLVHAVGDTAIPAALARAVIALNARLPVPGFGIDAGGRVVWCTTVRRQPRGVALQTVRAHVELAVDMAALGARHLGALLAQEGTRTAVSDRLPPAA